MGFVMFLLNNVIDFWRLKITVLNGLFLLCPVAPAVRDLVWLVSVLGRFPTCILFICCLFCMFLSCFRFFISFFVDFFGFVHLLCFIVYDCPFDHVNCILVQLGKVYIVLALLSTACELLLLLHVYDYLSECL